MTVAAGAARLAAAPPAIAQAHFRAAADPYDPVRNPGGYVNLGTAENRLMWDLLRPKLAGPRPRTAADVHYGLLYGLDSLREGVSRLLARTWRRDVSTVDIVVVSGASAALDIAASVLCEPGQAILVPTPYYSGLDVDLTGRSGARLVPVPMTGLDAPALDAALRRVPGVAAVAISSPSNPEGRVYGAAALRAFLEVAARHRVHVIADEIYAHSVYGPAQFVSVRSVGDSPMVHVIWGFAKDFALPGLKVGVLHSTDPAVRDAARALAYFAPVSTDTQALLADLLADHAWVDGFLRTNASRLRDSHARATAMLTRHKIRHTPAQAGLSLWTDLRCHAPTFEAETALWQHISRTARVNILPGRVFGAAEPGWFRLCHAVDPAHVATGIDRIAAAVATGWARRPA